MCQVTKSKKMKKLIICGTAKDVSRIIENLVNKYGRETTLSEYIAKKNKFKLYNKNEVWLC